MDSIASLYAWVLKQTDRAWLAPIHGEKSAMAIGAEMWKQMRTIRFEPLVKMAKPGHFPPDILEKARLYNECAVLLGFTGGLLV